MPRPAKLLVALLLAHTVGCSLGGDPALLAAAELIVPRGSVIVDRSYSNGGVIVRFDAGDLGAAFSVAAQDRAGGEGWEPVIRCDLPEGDTIAYLRGRYDMRLTITTSEVGRPEGIITIAPVGTLRPMPEAC